jgi:hypothetical protein
MLKAAESQNTGKPLRFDGGGESTLPEESQLVQIMVVAGARNHHYLQLWRLVA